MPVILNLNLTLHQTYQTAVGIYSLYHQHNLKWRSLILTCQNVDIKEIGSCMLKNMKINYCGQSLKNLRQIFQLNWSKERMVEHPQLLPWETFWEKNLIHNLIRKSPEIHFLLNVYEFRGDFERVTGDFASSRPPFHISRGFLFSTPHQVLPPTLHQTHAKGVVSVGRSHNVIHWSLEGYPVDNTRHSCKLHYVSQTFWTSTRLGNCNSPWPITGMDKRLETLGLR